MKKADLSGKAIRPGDAVVTDINGYEQWLTVERIENEKLFCCDTEEDESTVLLVSEVVRHVPVVSVSTEQIRRFLRCEAPFHKVFPGVEHYSAITVEQPYLISPDDLLAALEALKKKSWTKAITDWILPAGYLFGQAFVFEEAGSEPDPAAAYRFLPTCSELLFDVFDTVICYEEGLRPDWDDLISRVKGAAEMVSLPVPARRYDVCDKESYIKAFDNEEMLASADEKELSLFIQYVDELCEKDNVTALYAKAYSLYGGNRAYACDWQGARDLFLRLTELDENPALANTLGYLFYYGRCNDGEPEYEKAFYYYNIGAAGGVYESRCKLADMYRHGYAVRKNERIADSIIRELYADNEEHVLLGHANSKFADIALRMGNLNKTCDPDEAFYYYLQADFAIRQRMKAADHYGDRSVAAGIRSAMEEILPETSFARPCRTVYPSTLAMLFRSAFALRRTVKADIKKSKDGSYLIRFSIFPRHDEKVTPKFFVTVPPAHFCGYLDRITVHVSDIRSFLVDGEAFDGEEAVVLFDEADWDTYKKYGDTVMTLSGEFKIVLPSQTSQKRYTLASVVFEGGGKRYDYFCEPNTFKAGDTVVVPTPYGEKEALVAAVFERTPNEMFLPLSKYKTVLRKAEKGE